MNTLAPWLLQQNVSLLSQQGHAWLLQGPSGLGQYALASAMVSAWLCESPNALTQGACGQCGSCHALSVHTHADLFVLMPETILLELGWPLSEKAQSEIDNKSRKPSKEIRIDAMRDAIEFSQRTNARGRGKAVLVFPAERMNHVTANALLKTLEEPPGDVKFVLATEAAHQLLPTIRSRCLIHTMIWPSKSDALNWLESQGISNEDSVTMLKAAGGRPDEVLRQQHLGQSVKWWSQFPRAMLSGDASFCADIPSSEVIDALQKLCHDLMMQQTQAPLRFFNEADLPKLILSSSKLSAWFKRLAQAAKTSEHPFNAGLMLEALCTEAREIMNSPT
ncbi:MAG: DNA polymerase III subunit delta' [Burkholderiales bacterium]|nr:DNA polymerase III subunit delta' [Burkholderiales bacterium]